MCIQIIHKIIFVLILYLSAEILNKTFFFHFADLNASHIFRVRAQQKKTKANPLMKAEKDFV